MDNNFGLFITGIMLASLIMASIWLNTEVVRTTDDGKFYIKTHGYAYELKSDKPVIIKTHSSIAEEN